MNLDLWIQASWVFPQPLEPRYLARFAELKLRAG